jgi:hypothetical protein
LVLLTLAAGCGGGGGGSTTTGGGTSASVGTLSAKVTTAGVAVSTLQVSVDGQPVTAPIAADGSFTVPGLPPGDHVVDVVENGGMMAGRATFTITGGGTATLPVPIPLTGSGLITGMVTTQAGTGPSTPMAGVEVDARGGLTPMMGAGGSTTVGSPTDPTAPLIYPPPPLLTYTAITAADGTYKMTGVASGPYLVSVVVPGFKPAYAWVFVTADATVTADFVLEAVVTPGIGTVSGTVTGSKTDGTTAPLEGATVIIAMGTAWIPPAPQPMPMMSLGASAVATPIMPPPDIAVKVFRTLTDASGHYSLNVPAGAGKAIAWAQGYVPNNQAITVTADATLPLDFLLKELTNVPPMPPPVPPGPPAPPGGGTTSSG